MLDFVVIGTEKCGSNSLRRQLAQHPGLFPSVRGHYFLTEGSPPRWQGPDVDTILKQVTWETDRYRDQFRGAPQGARVGEVATLYLYDVSAAERMATAAPQARLIAILRNPSERAYSNYVMMRRDEREPADTFEEALRLEPERITTGWGPSWHYAAKGFYFEQLLRYRRHFPAEQLRVLFYEDYRNEPQDFLAEIFDYLGVPQREIDTSKRYNVSGIPRWAHLQRVLKDPDHWFKRVFVRPLLSERARRRIVHSHLFRSFANAALQKAPPMKRETHAALVARYEEDTARLEDWLHRDLSAWRAVR